MSRPNGLISSACSGVTTVACSSGVSSRVHSCLQFVRQWALAVYSRRTGHGEPGQPIARDSEEPAERFETEQQATGHLIGSKRPDHVLVHRQNVAQAAIEWSLLIDCSATCRLVNKLHHIDADANDVRIGRGE